MACKPPAQMTMTMPMLTKMVRAGDMLDMNCITLTDCVGEVLVGGLEALAFEIGAHEGLDQAHPGDIFLQDGVQPVQFLLDDPEERLHLDDEEHDE